ncbi:unnamed protein product, partial [Laminaria digitata]
LCLLHLLLSLLLPSHCYGCRTSHSLPALALCRLLLYAWQSLPAQIITLITVGLQQYEYNNSSNSTVLIVALTPANCCNNNVICFSKRYRVASPALSGMKLL